MLLSKATNEEQNKQFVKEQTIFPEKLDQFNKTLFWVYDLIWKTIQ